MLMAVALFFWLHDYQYLGVTESLLMNSDNDSLYVKFRVNRTTDHSMNFETLENTAVLKR
jgi:hypothetical protein